MYSGQKTQEIEATIYVPGTLFNWKLMEHGSYMRYVWSETDLAKPSISAISVRLLVCFGHLYVASVFPRQAMAGMLAACYQQSTNNVHI